MSFAGGGARRLLGLTLTSLLFAGAVACAGSARPAPRGPSPALFNREAYAFITALGARAEARRYSLIVLQPTDGWRIPMLRRYNPHLIILMYQAILKSEPADPQACTNYLTDLAHPDWFLRGATGAILTASSGYEMDIGNHAYQQACFANAVAVARHGGFNGIYLDGVDASSSYGFPPNAKPTVPKYPSDAAWQAAMSSLLDYAGPVVHSAGLLLFANIGGGVPALWRAWNGPLDGAEEESWTDGKLGLAQQAPFWSEKLANVAWSESHGRYVLLHSWNTSRSGNVYGLASMLLVADGRTTYSTSNANYGGYEAWYPEYTTATRLGAPLGPYRRLRNGVYERRFAAGLVLVNPRLRSVRRFSLPGRYSGSGLRRVRAVSMGPVSGLILLGG